MTKTVDIFTDGACSGNPGPGGYGIVMKYGTHVKEKSGGEKDTTNNRMEMMACIVALESLKESVTVNMTTDSQYVKKGIQQWIHNWKKNGWKTSAKKPVKNQDLWIRLDAQMQLHTVNWFWVKGHAGHPDNERADELARNGIPK